MYLRTCPSGAQTKMQRVSFTEMSDKNSVGALLVGLWRCSALVGGQVVLLPVVLCFGVVAKMSGGSRPPALVPVNAGLCRSLGFNIFLYTCAPGLPGMKTAMLAPRNKKCEKHFPSRQHQFCTSLEVFFLVVRVTRRKKYFFSSPCGAPLGGPSGGLGPAPPPPTHTPTSPPPPPLSF